VKVDITPGILPFALRASLRLFKFAPGEFVKLSALPKRWISVTAPHCALARSTPVRFTLAAPIPNEAQRQMRHHHYSAHRQEKLNSSIWRRR